MKTIPKKLLRTTLFLALATVFSSCAKKELTFEKYEPWKPEIVEAFKGFPIQEGGRIKPVEASARVRLLRYRARKAALFYVGKEDGKPEAVEISPTEWMLDTLFRPELASKMPIFVVNDSDAIVALGLVAHDKRRDRYSFDELIVARDKLSELGGLYGAKPEAERNGKENQIVDLSRNVSEFGFLRMMFDFGRVGAMMNLNEISPVVSSVETESVTPSQFFRKLPAIKEALIAMKEDEQKVSAGAMERGWAQLNAYERSSAALAILPPESKETKIWLTPGQLITAGFAGFERGNLNEKEWEIGQLERLEALSQMKPNSDEFAKALISLTNDVKNEMEARGEGEHIGLELNLYKQEYFYKSLMFFIYGFLCVAAAWLAPGSKFGQWMGRGAVGLALIAVSMLVAGITLRCIVMQRPPVGNLYETILFVTATSAIVGLIVEGIVRWKIALSVSLVLGMIGMFMAGLFDTSQATDTMDPLVAVLRSNFWLATHVTTVTFGYSAVLLAGAIAHVYIFSRLFNGAEQKFLKIAVRMVYGVVCFALLLSLVGTVLGGIWANDSWGRFWGWDPKENGALMIVLWNLVILHARLGGIIRDLGLAIFAVIGNIIVAFSWWWVNIMQVGLHSYGFISGIKKGVLLFWGIEVAVVLIGIGIFLREKYGNQSKATKARLPKKLKEQKVAG
jgi:ABC-type transport system involved in cytochrome c biogenesis permease subunit